MSGQSEVGGRPDISFVVPFRNEERFLEATLASLAAQHLGPIKVEVILVDGVSEDSSRHIAEAFLLQRRPGLTFRVLDNPRRSTAAAFNLGIAEARAPVVGFGGAHTLYPKDYLRTALEVLRESEADVVGGGHDAILPADMRPVSIAASYLYQCPMGAGVAAHHRRRTPGYVDTVYGGFYRQEVFGHIGLFNERLARNQDNELNARVTSAGMRIYFHPSLATKYVQKTNLRAFLKRGYTDGRFHPATWRANPKAFRFRHAVPASFLLYGLILAATAVLGVAPWWVALPATIYFVLVIASGVYLAVKRSALPGLLTIPLFVAYHFSYGIGTLVGMLRFGR